MTLVKQRAVSRFLTLGAASGRLAGMATKTPRRKAPASTTVPLPTHEQGKALFDQVLLELQARGWERHRVDTLRHLRSPADSRDADTIRHHYDHGVWELYLEPDRYWAPNAKPIKLVKIRLDQPLPTAAAVADQLTILTS